MIEYYDIADVHIEVSSKRIYFSPSMATYEYFGKYRPSTVSEV